MGSPVMQLSGVTKTFGGVAALRDVSFELLEGEVHAIAGENGAGKSTLVKIMSGAVAPDSGTVSVGGRVFRHMEPTEALSLGIATVHQEYNLLPDLTVAENVIFDGVASWLGIVHRQERDRRVESILASIGARTIRGDRLVRELTVAEQQLVEIAKALALDAKVLILDEPTAAIGSREVAGLFRAVRDLTRRGTAVVFITHRVPEIFQIANRITVLKDGALVTTVRAGDISADDLVRQMIGRPLSAEFPARLSEPAGLVLEIRDLTLPGLLEGVTVEVRGGEIVGLSGLGGSGRTTICEVVAGLRARPHHTVRIGGRGLRPGVRVAAKAGVVMIPEDRKQNGLFLRKSITFNVLTRAAMDRRPVRTRRAATKFVTGLINRFGIKAANTEMPAGELSGGNQQKVILAKWLSMKPRVVVLDEPTRGVDVGAKAEIYRLVDDLRRQGAAIVLASSELIELIGLCDRIVVLFEGKVAGTVSRADATEEAIARLASGAEIRRDEPRRDEPSGQGTCGQAG